jgi:hypothetical protein
MRDYEMLTEDSMNYIREVISRGGFKGPKYFRKLNQLKVVPGIMLNSFAKSAEISLPAPLLDIFYRITKYDQTTMIKQKEKAYLDFRKIALAVLMYVLSIAHFEKGITIPFRFIKSLIGVHRAIYLLGACEKSKKHYDAATFNQIVQYFFSGLSLHGLYFPTLSMSLNERHLLWLDGSSANEVANNHYPLPNSRNQHIKLIDFVQDQIANFSKLIDELLMSWNKRNSYLSPDNFTISMEKDLLNYLNLLLDEQESGYHARVCMVNDQITANALLAIKQKKYEIEPGSSTERTIQNVLKNENILPYEKLALLMDVRPEIKDVREKLKDKTKLIKKSGEIINDFYRKNEVKSIINKNTYTHLTLDDVNYFHFGSKATRNTEDQIMSRIALEKWNIEITKDAIRFQLNYFEHFNSFCK